MLSSTKLLIKPSTFMLNQLDTRERSFVSFLGPIILVQSVVVESTLPSTGSPGDRELANTVPQTKPL